jgi:cytochrome c-type biogenesis protein CcmH
MIAFTLLAVALAGASLVFFVPGLWQVQRSLALGLGGVFLLLAGGAYWVVGQPAALRAGATAAAQATSAEANAGTGPAPSAQAAMAEMTPQQIAGMVQRLAERLQAEPDNAAGWRMLARSYDTLGRFNDAVLAYQRVLTLEPPDADLLVDYAVSLGMESGQTLVGDPELLLERALRLDPTHVQALALSGSAAFERHDYAHATAQWQRLLDLTTPDAPTRATIQSNIDKARALAANAAAH